MDKYELMWLENAAIRFVTRMNYKTNEQIINTGLLAGDTPIVMDDIKLLARDLNTLNLGDKSKEVIRDVMRNEERVKLEVEKYLWMIEQYNIKLVPKDHKDYPYSWMRLSGMPPLIFARGDTSILSKISRCGSSPIKSTLPGAVRVSLRRSFVQIRSSFMKLPMRTFFGRRLTS